MIDLSHLARNGPWVTSQAGGNMTASNAAAGTAAGSPPVDPVTATQSDPAVTVSDAVPVGTPAPRVTTGGYVPAAAAWTAG